MRRSINALCAAVLIGLLLLVVGWTRTLDRRVDEQLERLDAMRTELAVMEADMRELRKPVQSIYYITAAPETVEPEEPIEESEPVSLGTFRLTAYCPCAKCCGKWAGGITATGVQARPEHTIAVDPRVIPLGSTVVIDGREYVAEDTGSGINGQSIDIYFSDHQEAVNFGLQHKEVFIKTIIEKEK